MTTNEDYSKVTRVVVVNHDSTYREHWAMGWDLHLQDEGRTLKLFPQGDSKQADEARVLRDKDFALFIASSVHKPTREWLAEVMKRADEYVADQPIPYVLNHSGDDQQ